MWPKWRERRARQPQFGNLKMAISKCYHFENCSFAAKWLHVSREQDKTRSQTMLLCIVSGKIRRNHLGIKNEFDSICERHKGEKKLTRLGGKRTQNACRGNVLTYRVIQISINQSNRRFALPIFYVENMKLSPKHIESTLLTFHLAHSICIPVLSCPKAALALLWNAWLIIFVAYLLFELTRTCSHLFSLASVNLDATPKREIR